MTFALTKCIITDGGNHSVIDVIILTVVACIVYCCTHYGDPA